MPCKVGITTRPDERRGEWERAVIGLSNWEIIGEYSTKEQAQAHEDRYAAQNGCQASHDGPDPDGTWYVYRFDYTRTRIDTKWIVIVPILAALVGAVVTGLFTIWNTPDPPPPPPPEANIQQPKPRETVGRSFVVAGNLVETPDGYHVWLGVEIGGLLWPKEPEIPTTDRRFSVEIVEGGSPPGGRFSLTLFQVSPEGQKSIANWVDTGQKTGDLPGLDPRNLNGFSQLDRVDDLSLW